MKVNVGISKYQSYHAASSTLIQVYENGYQSLLDEQDECNTREICLGSINTT